MFLRALAIAGVLLVATSSRSGEPRSIGPEACAACHSSQHKEWQGHAHAKAYLRLAPKDRTNKLCLTCHAPDPERREAGVTCETCHGPGSEYQEEHLMRDQYLRGYLGLKVPKFADCQTCHQSDHMSKLKPIDLKKLWNKLHHSSTPAASPPPPAPTPPVTP